MTETPLASVVILNHNRKDLLRATLLSALEINYPNLEWIVVDNCSTDGSQEMVKTEFGAKVQLIERSENIPTAARNQGVQAAHGDIVLSLDNDILCVQKDMVERALRTFKVFPEAAILSFRIHDARQDSIFLREHWWHPMPIEKGESRFFWSHYYTESAAFIRRSLFLEAGGYDESIFMGHEQADVFFRLLRGGHRILYTPGIVCLEQEARGMLAPLKRRIHYFNLRNKLWTVWKYYPFWRGLGYAAGRIAASGMAALRYGWPMFFLRGLWDGLFPPPQLRARRDPLPAEAWRIHDKIMRGWFADLPNFGGEKK